MKKPSYCNLYETINGWFAAIDDQPAIGPFSSTMEALIATEYYLTQGYWPV